MKFDKFGRRVTGSSNVQIFNGLSPELFSELESLGIENSSVRTIADMVSSGEFRKGIWPTFENGQITTREVWQHNVASYHKGQKRPLKNSTSYFATMQKRTKNILTDSGVKSHNSCDFCAVCYPRPIC